VDEPEVYRQYSGGSNAQSSLIQALDIALGIQHRPTGQKAENPNSSSSEAEEGSTPPPKHNFITEMRNYMPGPHRNFLEHLTSAANLKDFVKTSDDADLHEAYDACLAMLKAFRDKHIQVVSRYIIIPAKSAQQAAAPSSPREQRSLGLAEGSINADKKKLRGTGGTALIPFLKQARDETGEPAIGNWVRGLIGRREIGDEGEGVVCGLAGQWSSEGGICHW